MLGPATANFICELGQLITARTGERRETEWLYQRLSIAVVRGNAAAVLSTAATERADTRLTAGADSGCPPKPAAAPAHQSRGTADARPTAGANSGCPPEPAAAPARQSQGTVDARPTAGADSGCPPEPAAATAFQTASDTSESRHQPWTAGSGCGAFGLLAHQAKQINPSDFDIPWGEMFGARPKH